MAGSIKFLVAPSKPFISSCSRGLLVGGLTGIPKVAEGLCKDTDVLHIALTQTLWVEAAAAHAAARKVYNERWVIHPRLVDVQPPAQQTPDTLRAPMLGRSWL